MSYPDTENYTKEEKKILDYFWNYVTVPLGKKDITDIEKCMYDSFTRATINYLKFKESNKKLRSGQIYKDLDSGWRYVITLHSPGDTYIIWENGACQHKSIDIYERSELIAEYSTWQEAVNSKEFK